MSKSLAEQVAALSEEDRLKFFEGWSEQQMADLQYDWSFWGRPEQSPPKTGWHIFLALAGRGWGKSRAGAEWIKQKASVPNTKLILLGRTSNDVTNVMVSAIMDAYPPDERPHYNTQRRILEFQNGSTALCASSEKPDQLRGPQAEAAWVDELCALKNTKDSSGANSWDNLLACVRLGKEPQIFATTTPKREPTITKLLNDAKDPKMKIKIIRGSTFENAALSSNYIETITAQYGDSDLAKQELYGETLEDPEGLVFSEDMIQHAMYTGELPPRCLKFIAVDPSVSETPNDECGIIVAAVTQERELTQRRIFILEDASIKASPDIWAKQVVDAAARWGAKHIVYEKNQGGALVGNAITALDNSLTTIPVVATKNKKTRAEPVVVAMQADKDRGLTEEQQKRVNFIENMPELFDQMVFWDPETHRYSPDRLDAFVYAVIAGLITSPPGLRATSFSAQSAARRKLPQGIGTGRSRINGSIRRR